MITDSELIGKYFDKSLTEEEKILFKQKYETEPEFKQAVQEWAQIIVALKASGLEKETLVKETLEKEIAKEIKIFDEYIIHKKNVSNTKGELKWIYFNDLEAMNTAKIRKTVSTLIAAVAVLLLLVVFFVFNQKVDERDLQIAELRKAASTITILPNDSLRSIVQEREQKIVQLQDSLKRSLKTGTQVPPNTPVTDIETENNREKISTLLAMHTVQDEPTKGSGDLLQFKPLDRKAPLPAGRVVVAWTPVNKTGDITLYRMNDRNSKEPVDRFSAANYDLNRGQYPLLNLQENSVYVFEIKIGRKIYRYLFDTK